MNNDTELNEDELWELLQDPQSAPDSSPEQAAPAPEVPSSPAEKTVITEKRKRALVWYLAGLFGIAFVVVLLSLFLRGQSQEPGSTTPADNSVQIQELYDRINQLESEKAELEQEKESLAAEILDQQEMMDNLNIMINELSNSLEYTENNQFYSEDSQLYRDTLEAYKLLVRAQNAFIDYDEEVLESTMKELETKLNVLSDEGKNAYYMVIEYMEQPYLGH